MNRKPTTAIPGMTLPKQCWFGFRQVVFSPQDLQELNEQSFFSLSWFFSPLSPFSSKQHPRSSLKLSPRSSQRIPSSLPFFVFLHLSQLIFSSPIFPPAGSSSCFPSATLSFSGYSLKQQLCSPVTASSFYNLQNNPRIFSYTCRSLIASSAHYCDSLMGSSTMTRGSLQFFHAAK